jgi:signal transduction histidine kinase
MSKKEQKTSNRICFVISPIGPEKSTIRERADQILEFVIKPVTRSLGYNTVRADDIGEPGVITSQVIRHILEDDVVIADLAGHNPNVFYELALRHVTGKPVVQMIQSGESLPFDIAHIRTIHFDYKDLRSVSSCMKELTLQLKAVQRDKERSYHHLSELESFYSIYKPVFEIQSDRFQEAIDGLKSAMLEQFNNLQGKLIPHGNSARVDRTDLTGGQWELRDILHQVIAPLNAIYIQISNLRHGVVPDEKLQDRLLYVSAMVRVLINTVRSLDFLIMPHDQTRMNTATIGRVNMLLIDLAGEFSVLAQFKHLTIQVLNKSLSDCTLRMNESLFSVAISSLFNNAITYSYDPKAREELSRSEHNFNYDRSGSVGVTVSDHNPTLLEIRIENWGLPIEENERDLIFSKGMRGLKARDVTASGSGIGLYLAKEIVALHGGTIELVRGESLHHIIFCIRLPKGT